MRTVDLRSIVFETSLGKIEYPPPSCLDHYEHVFRTALAGHPQIAADHLLNKEMRGKLTETVDNVIRKLNVEFVKSKILNDDSLNAQRKKIVVRQKAYELLIEIAINLIGMERKLVGFSSKEIDRTFSHIVQTLETWGALEKKEHLNYTIIQAVVEKCIDEMKLVQKGKGMIAKMGEDIERKLIMENVGSSFVLAAEEVIQRNIYYTMAARGMCKFGNDYALGLRWLRHLGYVQESTNPTIVKRAIADNPRIWNSFKEIVEGHPEWLSQPKSFGDEIAMAATMAVVWPNLAIFRPIAILSRFHDGMISYQLDPHVAGSLEKSMNNALKVYSTAQKFLRIYDTYLMWGYSNFEERGRPNLSIKVAGNASAAIEITTSLNRIGLGTNNTVTFAVAQEVTLLMAAMKGMVEALKTGVSITQVYETHVIGRLESHLREVEAEKFLSKTLNKMTNKDEILNNLAENVGALKELAGKSLEEKIKVICSNKYLKSLTNPAFVEVLTTAKICGNSKGEVLDFLSRLEKDIEHAGVFVTKRVYKIFFSPKNRAKWHAYLQKEFNISVAVAEEIIDKIDILPASKRKPFDTFFTLAQRNMTNTESPSQQLKILQTSCQDDFNLLNFENAIMKDHDSGILRRLLNIQDFRKAYELTFEYVKKLREIGIEGDFGEGGLKISEWSKFGPVVKMMTTFMDDYEELKRKSIDIVSKM